MILKEICGIKENLASFFKLSANTKTKLPTGLLKQLHETFKCHICSNTPMKPPIIFARCCKRILGCQSCVDKWYRREGEESTTLSCPLCLGERAYAETSIIKGMDDFLLSIAPMLSELNIVMLCKNAQCCFTVLLQVCSFALPCSFSHMYIRIQCTQSMYSCTHSYCAYTL